jgi:hypothetical protein
MIAANYGENSGDFAHAEPHFRTPSYNQFFQPSLLFSKITVQRKDLRKITSLPWAQEVPSSDLGAPTTYFFVFNELFPILQRWKPNLGSRRGYQREGRGVVRDSIEA